jgi:hypothetical protein
MSLVLHNPKFASQIVSREALVQYAAPKPTRTWRPVSHTQFVDGIHENLYSMGLPVRREQYAIGKSGLALFGLIDLEPYVTATRGMSLGFRHSNDKHMSISLVGGCNVFVCDNLALSGEKIAVRKHTGLLDLAKLLREGLKRFLGSHERFEAAVRAAETHYISNEEAKVQLFDLRYREVLPASIYDAACENYFRATSLRYEDSQPRTKWGLHNACTRAVKALAPTSQFRTLTALGRWFGLY